MRGNDDLIRLGHMIRAIDKIDKYTSDIIFEQFEENEMIQDAVFKNLEIIGEAAYKISAQLKKEHGIIEWKKVEGLRHKLVHDYYQIDLKIIWYTKEKSLPILKNNLETVMSSIDKI